MSLEDKLARWAKTPAGKAKLQAASSGGSGGSGGGSGGGNSGSGAVSGGGGSPPSFYAEEFIKILRAKIALAGFEYGDYLYWTDVGYNKATGKYELHVNFNKGTLHRDSLYKDGYPEGIDNIAALMNRGYHAKDYVYGTMPDGRRGRSLKERKGYLFMQKAVEEFNAQYGANAIAECDDEYDYN